MVYQSEVENATVHFGYSSSIGMLEEGKCDQVPIQGALYASDDHKRLLLNELVRISGLMAQSMRG